MSDIRHGLTLSIETVGNESFFVKGCWQINS